MTRSQAYRGTGLEATLTLAHDLYAKRGSAYVRRYHLAGDWRRGRSGTEFRALPKAEQPPDYHGCVAGRMVVFDAKETDNAKRWRLDSRYAHQFDRLCWWSEAGALAFFAVECLDRETLYLLRMTSGVDWPWVDFCPPAPGDRLTLVPRNSEGWYDWIPEVQERGWLD